MAHYFKIFPEHNLVYMRYSGFGTIADYAAMIEEYTTDPQYDLQNKYLVDLRFLDNFERDYVAAMALQARIATYTTHVGTDLLSVIVAPTQIAMEAASLIMRSWEQIDTSVVRRVIPDMSHAASLLGLDEASLDRILCGIDRVAPND